MQESDAESSDEEEGRKRSVYSASEAEESDGKGGIVNQKVDSRHVKAEPKDIKPFAKMEVGL